MQSEGILLDRLFFKTESLRDLSQQPLAGLSAQLRRVRHYSAEYDIRNRRGKTQKLLQGVSPERVIARLRCSRLCIDQSADVLEIGANVGRPNQELVIEYENSFCVKYFIALIRYFALISIAFGCGIQFH